MVLIKNLTWAAVLSLPTELEQVTACRLMVAAGRQGEPGAQAVLAALRPVIVRFGRVHATELAASVERWARWRLGQCDVPEGLSDEERILMRLVGIPEAELGT